MFTASGAATDRDVFAGLFESGLNHFLSAFYNSRKQIFRYATPFYHDQPLITPAPVLPLPGFPSGLEYRLFFGAPSIDLFPGDQSPLPPQEGEFALKTGADIRIFDPIKQTNVDSSIQVFVRGMIERRSGDQLGFRINEVKTPGAGDLQRVVEAIIQSNLTVVLGSVVVPFRALTIEFFTLQPEGDPVTADDQIKLFGEIL